ncbi:hypothetical protein [Rhodococcus rhodochrous]|uniref:hypothetical protein n=1 Tax=Rhodococcus rhodochrous TaxID=1829 RepID=UPI0011C3E48B
MLAAASVHADFGFIRQVGERRGESRKDLSRNQLGPSATKALSMQIIMHRWSGTVFFEPRFLPKELHHLLVEQICQTVRSDICNSCLPNPDIPRGSYEDRRMMKKLRQSRWLGPGFVMTVAISGMFGATVGTASADTAPISISISGTEHYVNETYTITVHCEVRSTVGVTVNVDFDEAEQSDLIGGQPVDPGDDLLATVPWTPTSVGTHTIYAYGCSSGVGWPDNRPPAASLTVEVVDAPSTGSADGIPFIRQFLRDLFS